MKIKMIAESKITILTSLREIFFSSTLPEEREDKLREEALGGISTPQSFTFLLLLQFANVLEYIDQDFLQMFTNAVI